MSLRELEDLHPTQMTVGFREVAVKQRRLRGAYQRKAGERQASTPVPVVIGPQRAAYVLDGHHHLCALMAAGIAHAPVDVLADFSDLTQAAFWRRLTHKGWRHSIDGAGVHRSWRSMPRRLADLADDPFRSLSSELRRRGGFSKSFEPFSEFAWASYLRRHIPKARAVEDFPGALREAQALAAGIAARRLPGWRGPMGSTARPSPATSSARQSFRLVCCRDRQAGPHNGKEGASP